MQASKELWAHVQFLTKTDKESFEAGLSAWYSKWETFLKERKTDNSGKSRYVHPQDPSDKRLRSAYRSLKTNLTWLFTWYDHMDLKIPNTTRVLLTDILLI
jgi:hypothetical protein